MLNRAIYTYLVFYVIFVIVLISGADIDWTMGYSDYDPIEDAGTINIATFDKMDEKYDLRLSEDILLAYDGDEIVGLEDSKNNVRYVIEYGAISEEKSYNQFKDYSERVSHRVFPLNIELSLIIILTVMIATSLFLGIRLC